MFPIKGLFFRIPVFTEFVYICNLQRNISPYESPTTSHCIRTFVHICIRFILETLYFYENYTYFLAYLSNE